jgi:hypothetical protein
MNLKKWASARFFWIQVGKLYENRGPGKAGNQLDCVKGTRAFFGFDYINIDQITRNTKLGEIKMRAGSRPITSRSVWYANNSMDKVHLPVPGSFGPHSYDDRTIIFERTDDYFLVSIGSQVECKDWLHSSQEQGLCFEMNQGRLFGFFDL